MNKIYDVIVIGGGHSGCEAALASARLGCHTLLVTLHKNKIGFMSCNPAIGGVGKGQLVKEVDALGGEMARATDACGIQFRILNASKGPAVWSSRAQVDRKKYSIYMQHLVMNQKNLQVNESEVVRLIVNDKTINGVETKEGDRLLSKAVVIAPGTFFNGLIHIGMKNFAGGRLEEQQSAGELSDFLRDFGFRLLRFKTGTCARLDGKTINFSSLRVQNGDEFPAAFSFSTKSLNVKQLPCYITYTDGNTHSIIRRNLDRSPLFSGKIIGTGVRYCPSFEDKVIKFPHHERHQIFLEPEGMDTDEFYPNGLSTSLPEDVQADFIHSIPGLENVKINRYGYGIEHDVVDATQLLPTLETKIIRNLYLAGQINGSTGYEEAAAQGLVAGINAALRIKSKTPFILDRSTSYIGVLIDDLVTKGTNEPYRMLTSRVEYRLILREDNADLRLRKFGFEIGLVSKDEYGETLRKQEFIQKGFDYLKENKVSDNGKKNTMYQLLKRPQVTIKDFKEQILVNVPELENVLGIIETEIKYSGFIERQTAEVKDFKHLEKIKIPPDFNYGKISGLSSEVKEKLLRFKPMNLGQAGRISGITPAAITILIIYIRKLKVKKYQVLSYNLLSCSNERKRRKIL